jgi:ABC-2 type transport system ATP-binding protein
MGTEHEEQHSRSKDGTAEEEGRGDDPEPDSCRSAPGLDPACHARSLVATVGLATPLRDSVFRVALDTRTDADATGGHGAGNRAADPTDQRMAIEVRDVEKVFRIPTQRISRLKERLVNPFARREYRQLRALEGVSFDVQRGEFFGIVGRNGSGKSTLLKIMASIYRSDAGSVRMAGRVAPFIELGVGFDMELSARENIVLNAVMMGLTPQEARRRVDAALEFAELEEFAELKLKNYSSGMLVRLGFSVMVQADTDILLIDEVLAVGDAAFQQKCADVFYEMRNAGKTIVLVTHDMTNVEEYCHRAMVLSEGRIVQIGDPAEIARRYFRLNFERAHGQAALAQHGDGAAEDVRLLDVWLEGPDGKQVTSVEQREQIRLRVLLEAQRAVPGAQFGFVIANAEDVAIHEFVGVLSQAPGAADDLAPGQRVRVGVDVENRLSPGRYYLNFGVTRHRNRRDSALYAPQVFGFVVLGDQPSAVVVAADHEIRIETLDG